MSKEYESIIQELIGQNSTLGVHKIFIRATGDIRAALLLSQLWYWTPRTKNTEKWIYKSMREFQEELCLNEYAIKKAKEILLNLNIIETDIRRANGSPTTHYKVKSENLMELLKSPNGFGEGRQVDLVKVAKSLTKTTTKTNNSLSTSVDKVASDLLVDSFLLPDGVEKYKEGEELNKYWKSVGLKRGHRSLQSKFLTSGKFGGSERKTLPVWAPITSAIRMVGMKQLRKAVRNYKVYQDEADEYTPGANLSLGEFCFNTTYAKFIDSVPLNEIKSTNPWDMIRNRFSPLTSVYVAIFDPKTQRYYGFQTDKINSKIRWEDIETLVANKGKFDFDSFMELEWMIAGMLWRRSKGNQDELKICQKYMKIWEGLQDEFKKKARKWLKEDWELYG